MKEEKAAQEDKTIKAFSVRFRIEVYEKLKKYSEDHNESMNDLINLAVENFLSGSLLKPPSPGPGPAPEIPEEILGLPGRMGKIEEQLTAVQGYMNGLSERVEKYHRQVSQLLGIVGAPVKPFSAKGKTGKTEKRKAGRKKA